MPGARWRGPGVGFGTSSPKKGGGKGKAKAAPAAPPSPPTSGGGGGGGGGQPAVIAPDLVGIGAVLSGHHTEFQMVDASARKFYKVQVVQATDGTGRFWTIQAWGRIGTKGQTKVTAFSGAGARDQAIAAYEKVLKARGKKKGYQITSKYSSGSSSPPPAKRAKTHSAGTSHGAGAAALSPAARYLALPAIKRWHGVLRGRRQAAGVADGGGGGVIKIRGVTGTLREVLEGEFDLWKGGAAPVFLKRRSGRQQLSGKLCVWLYLASNKHWYISETGPKDGRIPIGWAFHSDEVVGGKPMPHKAPPRRWNVWDNQSKQYQMCPGVTVRAVAQAEADRIEAAAAVVWNSAAARGPATIAILGATGPAADLINGHFDCVKGARKSGEAPVYRRHGQVRGKDMWLFLSYTNQWFVGETTDKDTREDSGVARCDICVSEGFLPHDLGKGGWSVAGSDGTYVQQSSVCAVVAKW